MIEFEIMKMQAEHPHIYRAARRFYWVWKHKHHRYTGAMGEKQQKRYEILGVYSYHNHEELMYLLRKCWDAEYAEIDDTKGEVPRRIRSR